MTYYTFDSAQARSQIVTEFLQSFIVALNSLSTLIVFHNYPHKLQFLRNKYQMMDGMQGLGKERFGFEIVKLPLLILSSHQNQGIG